jgi:hypothetical protein
MKYVDKQELDDKIEWEGGIAEFTMGYGVNLEELPDETPDNVREAFRHLLAARRAVAIIQAWFDDRE